MKVIRSFTIDSDIYEQLRSRPGLNVSGTVNELLRKYLKMPVSEGVTVSLEQAEAIVAANEAQKAHDLQSLEAKRALCMEVYSKNLKAQRDYDVLSERYRTSDDVAVIAELKDEMRSLDAVMSLNLEATGFKTMNDLRAWLESEALIGSEAAS